MNSPREIGRFAPSPTGDAHPGTLLAGLLAWLDARSRGAFFVMRLEDLDVTRVRPGLADTMIDAFKWLGLDWDALDIQTSVAWRHAQALDALHAVGLLYPCSCSRAQIKKNGRKAPDGGFAYDNVCRDRPLADWRTAGENIRCKLPSGMIALTDESGLDLSQDPAYAMGDPIVFRKDGVVAYQLAVVVDDAAAGVTRVVRGRDIAPSTATQVALQRALGLPTPTYRHHFLLLEPHGNKLAKLHGSIGFETLCAHYTGQELCGWLSHVAGIKHTSAKTMPRALVGSFDWARVTMRDVTVIYSASRLGVAQSDALT